MLILDANTIGLKSIYTVIDGHFADIFFFDVAFVKQIGTEKNISAVEMTGMFVTWLEKGKIEYDPDGILQNASDRMEQNPIRLTVTEQERRDAWVKMNYNFIANTRYFQSGDPLYHQALQIRLAYSAVELITAYFSFRDVPWRGEKSAVEYLQQHDPDYLQIFQAYTSSTDLEQKMQSYRELFGRTLHGVYQRWDENFMVPMSTKHQYDPSLVRFWDSLMEEKKV